MKKEPFLAIFLGVLFGGIVGFILISKNKEIQINKNKAIAPTEKIAKNSKQKEVNFQALEISEPNDFSITDKNFTFLKGKVTKDSLIVIQSPIKDIVYQNEKEDFQIELPLALGENVIKIVVYPKDKQLNIQEKDLRVYYLKEEI